MNRWSDVAGPWDPRCAVLAWPTRRPATCNAFGATLKGPFIATQVIATQLNSTRCRVELSCVGEVSIATRRRNSTVVELCDPKSNTVIGTLAVDGWAVTFGTARRGLDGSAARPGPSSLFQMWQPTHQRPVYQLRIIRCGIIIAFGV